MAPGSGWATIRSGLSAGLKQPIDLDADVSRRVRHRCARRVLKNGYPGVLADDSSGGP
jgi:hypothetical protein